MVAPKVQTSFLNFLHTSDIKYEMIIDDVESSIREDKIKQANGRSRRSVIENGKFNYELFWSHEEINFFYNWIASRYPDIVKMDVIGKSIEMRDIVGIRVSKNSEFGLNPIVFVDAGEFILLY